MQTTLNIQTKKDQQIIDITKNIEDVITKSTIQEGVCVIYSPHTTAAITINENADKDVKSDFLLGLNFIVKDYGFRHFEGNSQAHIKTILTGKSQSLIINSGKIVKGVWDGIWFCEFDGPRERKVIVKITSD